MANPYVTRCSKVPDLVEFHVDPTYGRDIPENGLGQTENAWKSLDYAIGQVNSYGEAFGACNVIIIVRARLGADPDNVQTLVNNIRAKRIRFVSEGGVGTGDKTRLVINNDNTSLFLDCVFQGFMICSDFDTLGGLITFENCDFRVTQNVHNCDFRLVDEAGANVFNISEGSAIVSSNSTIRDDNTIYNWLVPDVVPTTKPVNNFDNTFYVCQNDQTGTWTPKGCEEGTMSIGAYRTSGATYEANPGQILGFRDDDLHSPVPINYFDNLDMESLNLQDYAPQNDTMTAHIFRVGRFVFTNGGFSEFGGPVPAGHASTGLIPLPERFRPPEDIKVPHVRGDNNIMTGLYTIFHSSGYITLATFAGINDTSGWNQPPASWMTDKIIINV
jgi:hypothetical protein